MDFFKWLSESVNEQKEYLSKKIEEIFLFQNKENQSQVYIKSYVDECLKILQTAEEKLLNPEDKQKSYTINKFLNKILSQVKTNPDNTIGHRADMIRYGVNEEIEKANIKYQSQDPHTKETLIRTQIENKLPVNTDKTTIEILVKKSISQNQSPEKVVREYLSKTKQTKDFKTIVKDGIYEIIEIEHFDSESKEKHLDDNTLQNCHVLFKGTKWCVRFMNYFENYLKNGKLYLIRKNMKPFLLGHPESRFLDVNDRKPPDQVMEEVAPVILKSGITSIIEKIIPFVKGGLKEIQKHISDSDFEKLMEDIISATGVKKIFYGFSEDGNIKISETFRTYKDFIESKNILINYLGETLPKEKNVDEYMNNINKLNEISREISERTLIDNLNEETKKELKDVFGINDLAQYFISHKYTDPHDLKHKLRIFMSLSFDRNEIKKQFMEKIGKKILQHEFKNSPIIINSENGENISLELSTKAVENHIKNPEFRGWYSVDSNVRIPFLLDGGIVRKQFQDSTSKFQKKSEELIAQIIDNKPPIDKEKYNELMQKWIREQQEIKSDPAILYASGLKNI